MKIFSKIRRAIFRRRYNAVLRRFAVGDDPGERNNLEGAMEESDWLSRYVGICYLLSCDLSVEKPSWGYSLHVANVGRTTVEIQGRTRLSLLQQIWNVARHERDSLGLISQPGRKCFGRSRWFRELSCPENSVQGEPATSVGGIDSDSLNTQDKLPDKKKLKPRVRRVKRKNR